MTNLILNNIHYISTDDDYTLEAVTGKTTRIFNSGSDSIVITLPNAQIKTLSPNKFVDYFYNGTQAFNITTLGGAQGLFNYLDGDASSCIADTAQGFSIVDETASPIDVNGCLKFVVPSGSNVGKGFYQDVVISAIHKNSKLQLQFYIDEHDVDADVEELSIKIIDTDADPDYDLFDAPITDYAVKNPVTGIYLFSAFIDTNNNSNLRVFIYQNAAVAAESEFMISGLSLGAPFYYTAPKNGLKAGEMYYSAEPPVDGKNSSVDLCFDGSTSHVLADYPDLNEAELVNANYINSDGTNFTVKKLRHVRDWVLTDIGDSEININHGLNVDPAELTVEMWYSGSSDGANALKVEYAVFGTASNYGVCLVAVDKDNLTIRYDTTQIYLNGSFAWASMPDPAFVKVVVKRNDAPAFGAYAYLRSRNQQTVELMAKQTSRSDFHEIIYSYKSPDANGLGVNGELFFDNSFTHQFAKYPELNADKANAGMILTDNLDGTFNMRNLKHDTGWVAGSGNWMNKQLGDTLGSVINHGLGVSAEDLTIEIWFATDSSGANKFKIDQATLDTDGGATISYAAGITIYEEDTNSLTIQTASNQGAGLKLLKGSGTPNYLATIDTTDATHYRILVSRKEAPSEGMYAYLRTKSLSTVVLGKIREQSLLYPGLTIADNIDISAADYELNLAPYQTGGALELEQDAIINYSWKNGDASNAFKYHADCDLFVIPGIVPDGLQPGDASTTHFMTGRGSGQLILKRDKVNQKWIVIGGIAGGEVYDQGANGAGFEWKTYTNKRHYIKYTDPTLYLLSDGGTFAAGSLNYHGPAVLYSYPIPFKGGVITIPFVDKDSGIIWADSPVAASNTGVRLRGLGNSTSTGYLGCEAEGESRD